MLTGIVGRLGAGKTLLLTFFMFVNRKHFIITNFKCIYSDLIMPFEEMILRMDELAKKYRSKFRKIVFGIDELGILMKATDFMTSESEILDDIIRKSRKKGVDIIFTTQHENMIDRNIRRICDTYIIVEYDMKYKTVIAEIFMYRFRKLVRELEIKINAKKLFNKYDTDEVIAPDREKLLKLVYEQRFLNNTFLQNQLKHCTKTSEKLTNIIKICRVSRTVAEILLTMSKQEV